MKVVLQNLTKKYPNRDKNGEKFVAAVNDFNSEIPDGKLVGLLGPSGCGKSTALNLISGLETPTDGKIFFGDDDVTNVPPEKRGVGLVFQNYALYPHMTVRQNIMFPLTNLKGNEKLSKEEMEKRVVEAAKLVQIDGLLGRKPSQMSGGQQQRVAIARALVKKPKILLLDEPLSNLDARLRIQTREEIRRIQKETGITTIFVTHDQDEAMSISDIIIVMKLGVINQVGKPQEVYDNPVNLFVAKFLGVPPINVFEGNITEGKLCIGEDKIFEIKDCEGKEIENKKVFVGIRPEGFALNENGSFKCDFTSVEIMGRDTSVICGNEKCISGKVRAILPAENVEESVSGKIGFYIKKNKIFVFDGETEKRIFCTLSDI